VDEKWSGEPQLNSSRGVETADPEFHQQTSTSTILGGERVVYPCFQPLSQ